MYFNVMLCLCLMSHQQLRPYGDGPQLKVSSDKLVKPRVEPATPGLQGEWFIHYTTAAPMFDFDLFLYVPSTILIGTGIPGLNQY